MALTQIIYLTQANFGVHPVAHAVQNDTGRNLKMVIKDVALSGSPTAELYFTRSDETHFSTNAEFDSQDNSFTADISQALTQAGNTRCTLTVTDSNNKTVSSYPFLIVVHESQDGTSEAQLGYSIEEITNIIDSARGGGLTEDMKQALLACFNHVGAWSDAHGQDYVDALEAALYPPAVLTSITAYYNQVGTIYDTDDLDDLKPNLTVMANYDNGQSVPVSTYTLSGSLVAGTSTIRVNYDTKYTTFDVTVTHMPGIISVVNNLVNATNSNSATTVSEGDSYTATISPASGYTLTGASVIITMGSTDITSSAYSNGAISIDEVTDTLTISVSAVAVTLVSISAVYTQSGTVYNTDSLDSLKDDLVVTATWSDSTTTTLEDYEYTLSGTLAVGTSTVTVSYQSKTDTFTVTVTKAIDYTENPLANVTWTETSTGYYTSSMFEVQDCPYKFTSSNPNTSAQEFRIYDSNDTSIGVVRNTVLTNGILQLKPEYKYSLYVKNTSGDFQSSDVSFMPVDNRSNAIPTTSVDLYDYKDDIAVSGTTFFANYKYFYIPYTSFKMADIGLGGGNRSDKVAHVNYFYMSAGIAGVSYYVDDEFIVGTDYSWDIRDYILTFSAKNMSTVADMQAYIETNRPVVIFN